MNLFLISQTSNRDYDTYDSAVVCAKNEDHARKMSPGGENGEEAEFGQRHCHSSWAYRLEDVSVKLIGKAVKGMPVGVVCSSFNAG